MSYKLLFALAAAYDLKIEQINVRAAFLYSKIDVDIYIEQPEGFCDSSGGMSPVHVLLTCTRLPLSKRDTLASVSEAIKARPRTL
jgi:hypothetical protein